MYGRYEEFGLEEVYEIDFEQGGYDWDVVGIWWHPATESYRVSRDSGCSCSSPWEYYGKLEDYGPPLTYSQAWSAIEDADYYEESRAVVEKAAAITALRDFEAKRIANG